MKIGDTYKTKGVPYELVCVESEKEYYDYSIKVYVGEKLCPARRLELETLVEYFKRNPKEYNKYAKNFSDDEEEGIWYEEQRVDRCVSTYSILKPVDPNINHTYLVIKRGVESVEHPEEACVNWSWGHWRKGIDTKEVLDLAFAYFECDESPIMDCWGSEFYDYLSKNTDKELTIIINSDEDGESIICEGRTITTPDDYDKLFEDRELSLVSDHPQDLAEFYIVPKNDNKAYYLLREYDYANDEV